MATSVYLSLRGPDLSLVYKFLFPINKQFSVDSFLDWVGHSWVIAHLYQITAPHSLPVTSTMIHQTYLLAIEWQSLYLLFSEGTPSPIIFG